MDGQRPSAHRHRGPHARRGRLPGPLHNPRRRIARLPVRQHRRPRQAGVPRRHRPAPGRRPRLLLLQQSDELRPIQRVDQRVHPVQRRRREHGRRLAQRPVLPVQHGRAGVQRVRRRAATQRCDLRQPRHQPLLRHDHGHPVHPTVRRSRRRITNHARHLQLLRRRRRVGVYRRRARRRPWRHPQRLIARNRLRHRRGDRVLGPEQQQRIRRGHRHPIPADHAGRRVRRRRFGHGAVRRTHLRRRYLPHARFLLSGTRQHRLEHEPEIQPRLHSGKRHPQGRPERRGARRGAIPAAPGRRPIPADRRRGVRGDHRPQRRTRVHQ